MADKMNPEVKAKWVAALRSGQYKQGVNCLRDGDTFCCLGVLCDVVEPTGWNHNCLYGDDRYHPPHSVADVAGFAPKSLIEKRIPQVEINGKFCPLALHNDSGRTFQEIADAIEEQL